MNPADSESEGAAPASLPQACGLLAAALLAVLPLFIGFGILRFGAAGAIAALVSCGVCFLAGVLALMITAISQRLHQGVQGILGAMLVRMSVPLLALFLLPQAGGPLADSGVAGMLIGFYLVTLAVETWLSLRFVAAGKSTAAKVA